MIATVNNPTLINSGDIRREKLARHIEGIIAKCSNSYKENDALLKQHDEIRSGSDAIFQAAINDFVSHAKAEALSKKKKSEDEMASVFVLLMTHAAETAYQKTYSKLESLQGKTLSKLNQKKLKSEAEQFASERKQFYSNFPKSAIEKLKSAAETDEDEEKNIIANLNEAAESLKSGAGKVFAETESQAIYGAAQLRILQIAGFKTAIWQTMEDERVRPSHVECGDQGEVPLGKPFKNGLLYPGDPNGGAAEVCNCRCYLIGGRR